MSFFSEFATVVGGSVALVGAAAVLAKLLATHWLSKDLDDYKTELLLTVEGRKKELQADLESHKAKLGFQNAQALDSAKFEFEKELILKRGEIDIAREGFKFASESDTQYSARLMVQIQRWALPIRGAIQDLTHRLGDVLGNDGNVMLSRKSEPVDGWSATYDYSMSSTIYYFAQYFCWVRLMQQQLGHELFRSGEDMSAFFAHIHNVSSAISTFPLDKKDGDNSDFVDRQIFRLQQRALGELLVERSPAGDLVMTYKDFMDKWLDGNNLAFKRHTAPMELFLSDIVPEKDLRWDRLSTMKRKLQEFARACEVILQPQPKPSAQDSDA